MPRRTLIITATTLALAALPSTTMALPQDLRSPDARDAATPDVDLRSPDARDAARGVRQVPTRAPTVQVRSVPADGFDWGDAGIGAGGALALVSLATGTVLLAGTRRRRRQIPVATH